MYAPGQYVFPQPYTLYPDPADPTRFYTYVTMEVSKPEWKIMNSTAFGTCTQVDITPVSHKEEPCPELERDTDDEASEPEKGDESDPESDDEKTSYVTFNDPKKVYFQKNNPMVYDKYQNLVKVLTAPGDLIHVNINERTKKNLLQCATAIMENTKESMDAAKEVIENMEHILYVLRRPDQLPHEHTLVGCFQEKQRFETEQFDRLRKTLCPIPEEPLQFHLEEDYDAADTHMLLKRVKDLEVKVSNLSVAVRQLQAPKVNWMSAN
jgi:hypothetical protein